MAGELAIAVDAEEALAMLGVLTDRVADVAPIAEGIHAAFLEIEKLRFDEEGPGWAELAPSTVANKARLGQMEEILRATGALMKSFTTDDPAAGAVFLPVFTATGTSITMGSDYRSDRQTGKWAETALGSFHQYGTHGPGAKVMPARPIIDMDGVTLGLDSAEILVEWLTYGVVDITI